MDANVHPHLTNASMDPSRVHNPNSISIGSAVFAQLTAYSPCNKPNQTKQGITHAPSPLKIAPLQGDQGPHLIYDSFHPPRVHTHTASQSVQPFFSTADGIQSLHFTTGRPFPSLTCSFAGRPGPHLIYDSLDPPWVHTHTASQLLFAGLTVVTDRQTDRQTALLCLQQ